MKIKDYYRILLKRGPQALWLELKDNFFYDLILNINTQERLKVKKFQLYTPSYATQVLAPLHYLDQKISFKNYTFIDIGSGKGKALFLASRFSFDKIIGLENNKYLYNVSYNNLKKVKSKSKIKIYKISCFNFDYFKLNKKIIFYMYNPFNEKLTFKFLKKIKKISKTSKKNYLIFNGENEILKKIQKNMSFNLKKKIISNQYNRDTGVFLI